MTFSDPVFFLVFLPVALLGFQLLGRLGRGPALAFLVCMSLVFYADWKKRYTLLLIASILLNYLFSLAIVRSAKRPSLQTFWLTLGIVTNLAALCYYKYLFSLLNFFTGIGVGHHVWAQAVLPLGISFFTFTQIAYLVDLKQGEAEQQGLLSYSIFVTFFPHLIAGPIIHHEEMMPQFNQRRRYQLNRSDVAVGLTWFTMGLFKKVMVADRISPVADSFFALTAGVGALPAWLAVLTYAMQLYFDFSGYSDMAVGLARMFSIRFPFNFNSPYKASNIIDFWQRWHMTLTRYINLYLYNPMAVAMTRRRMRRGLKATKKAQRTLGGFSELIMAPMLVTMFLAGVWHGAGMQFILFGLVHGLYLTANHAWRIFVPEDSPWQRLLPRPVGVLLTFACVLVGQIFFRSASARSAFEVLGDITGRHGLGAGWPMGQIVLIAVLLTVVWVMPNTQEILGETHEDSQKNWSVLTGVRWSPTIVWWATIAAVLVVSIFYSAAGSTFLYFQF